MSKNFNITVDYSDIERKTLSGFFRAISILRIYPLTRKYYSDFWHLYAWKLYKNDQTLRNRMLNDR